MMKVGRVEGSYPDPKEEGRVSVGRYRSKLNGVELGHLAENKLNEVVLTEQTRRI